MDILTIEKSRNELLGFLEYGSSSRLKLKRISDFYSLLLKESENYLIESYLLEFLPQYIQYTKIYSPFGVKTEFTQSILAINEKLINSDELFAFRDQLITLNFNVKDKLIELEDLLTGQETLSDRDRKILFPVIEEVESTDSNLLLGAVDSLTIKISKAKFKDRFIVVPSAAQLDKKLEEQIKISWQKAKDFCNGYVKKINDYHEVIINFDEHLGVYKGDSVGVALSIGFIEQILKFYNSHTVLKPFGDVVFTGGVIANGEINQISKDIIEKKMEIAFYSPCRILLVPKIDENFALSKLEELKKEFPKRDLNIVSAKNIDEILLRRDLVEISSQQLIVRTGKFVKKNWVSALVTVILSILFAFLFVMDFDHNPALLENEGNTIHILNKNGKLLWTRKLWINLDKGSQYILNNVARYADIDKDGTNEILLCHDDFGDGINEMGRISCYNYKGDLIWKYTFKDIIRTINEVHSTAYSIGIVQNNRKANDSVIYCYISNHPLFPSAIFRLSARTGNRLDKGLWNAGHIVNAMLGDFNKDDKLELVALGVHNGFNSAILFSADPDSLNGQTPSMSNYFFADLPMVQPKSLVAFLPCDLTKYHNIRMNSAVGSTLMFDAGSEEFRFLIHEGIDTDCRSVHYRFDRNLKFLSVSPGNGFEDERDLLVNHGKLNPPRTNTPEYTKMLEGNIRYWKDGNWVKGGELKE